MRFELPRYQTCSFCDDLAGTRECVFVRQEELAAVEVDERQYERGAMLSIPWRHCESVLDIKPAELDAVYRLAKQMVVAAVRSFGAVGANIFQNNGAVAGQHEPHFHVHVVPRYPGSDPNKIFLQHEHTIASVDEQRSVADALRMAL